MGHGRPEESRAHPITLVVVGALLALIVASSSGCSLFKGSIDKQFTAACRDYYDFSTPLLRTYTEADPTLDEIDLSRRLERIEAHGKTLDRAEGRR